MNEFTTEQKAAIQAVIEAEVERRIAEIRETTTPAWKALLMGAMKSWTVRVGGLLVVMPELMDAVQPLVTDSFGPEVWKRVLQVAGVVMILLRAKTKESLTDIGAPK